MTWNNMDAERAAATRAAETVTGRKFCTSCQSMKPPEGGVIKPVRGGRATRWICAGCVSHCKTRR